MPKLPLGSFRPGDGLRFAPSGRPPGRGLMKERPGKLPTLPLASFRARKSRGFLARPESPASGGGAEQDRRGSGIGVSNVPDRVARTSSTLSS